MIRRAYPAARAPARARYANQGNAAAGRQDARPAARMPAPGRPYKFPFYLLRDTLKGRSVQAVTITNEGAGMNIRHETGSYMAPAPAELCNERSDCAVRALSVAACVDYYTAYTALAIAGRRKNRGTYAHQMYAAITRLVPDARQGAHNPVTIARFVRDNPRGHFILFVRWHFAAVCDGVLHDSMQRGRPRIKRHILRSWQLV